MKFAKNGKLFDTEKSELLFVLKETGIEHLTDYRQEFYITKDQDFFGLYMPMKKYFPNLLSKIFGIPSYSNEVEVEHILCFEYNINEMCQYINAAFPEERNKFYERFLKKTEEQGDQNMDNTNYSKVMASKQEYEDIKTQLEEIKSKMLELKQKAKDELNWIMNDEIE